MPPSDTAVDWVPAALWLAVVSLIGFLVAYALTDLMAMRRTPYVAALIIATLGLAAAYLLWSETGAADFVTANWLAGVIAGLVSGIVIGMLAKRQPVNLRRTGVRLWQAVVWEGGVYGIAEGVLLSALPPLIAWHAMDNAGWTDGPVGALGSGVLAFAAATFVVVVHHLGYQGFRGPEVALPVIACGLLTVGYLVTGSVLAPVIGHIVIHLVLVLHGTEMPPYERLQRGIPGGRPIGWAAPAGC